MRKTKTFVLVSAALAALLVALRTGEAWAITIDTVPVGNVGNVNDPLTGSLYGGVAYSYRIGTTEVTNSQYAAFLNEKAKSDPLELYNTSMSSDAHGGIVQSGSSPNFSYASKSDMGNKPVNFVSWYDTIRFVNWLNNGQGAGDTETGTYTLLGGTSQPTNGQFITREPNATWFLPSENEWYKAAYFDPRTAVQGGPPGDGHYWLYPTASNGAPTVATANGVGDVSNPGMNIANYNFGADWNGQNGNATTVGGAGVLSASYYGTYDQGGNVFEWNEQAARSNAREYRGGAWQNPATYLSSSFSDYIPPYNDADNLGFRVARTAVVPEPTSMVLLGIGALGLVVAAVRRRF